MAATAEDAWALSEELEALGALSVSLEPCAGSAGQLEPPPGATPLWPELVVAALFDAGRVAASRLRGRGLDPELRTHRDRDWIAAGREGFGPRLFGGRLWIVPEWCEAPADAAAVVRLAPGLAFGTGTHPTTELCLEWLAEAELAGKRVIDYGAGSGILALAAARLGAAEVVAVDNDPQALAAARANAKRNGVEVAVFAPGALPADAADVIVANILARPLVALANTLVSRLRPGGRLVLSGITAEQADAVAAAYAGRARLLGRRVRDGWVRLELCREPRR